MMAAANENPKTAGIRRDDDATTFAAETSAHAMARRRCSALQLLGVSLAIFVYAHHVLDTGGIRPNFSLEHFKPLSQSVCLSAVVCS